METSRFTFSADVTLYDFWDTYLPQYEAAFTKGGASGAMCSYMAANNVSSCGSNWLLNEVIREKWGRPDAVVMYGMHLSRRYLVNSREPSWGGTTAPPCLVTWAVVPPPSVGCLLS